MRERGCGGVTLSCPGRRTRQRGRGGEFCRSVGSWRMSFRLYLFCQSSFLFLLRIKEKTYKHSVEGRLGWWRRCHPRTRKIPNHRTTGNGRLITRLPTHLPTRHASRSSWGRRLRRHCRRYRKRRRLRILHLCPYFFFFIFSFILMFQVLHDCHDAVRVSFLLILSDTIVVEDLLPFRRHTRIFIFIPLISLLFVFPRGPGTYTSQFGNQIRHG